MNNNLKRGGTNCGLEFSVGRIKPRVFKSPFPLLKLE